MPYVVVPWLAEHVEVPDALTAERLAADLVRVGLEEEAVHTSGVTGPVVVGRVLDLSPEPQKNGKTINWCHVDVGEKDGDGTPVARGIVCGAHNFGVGDTVVVALPGAVLPGDFAIAARKTYGHVSDGMICSVRELGIGEDHAGILVLAAEGEEAPAPGADALEILGLTDEVLEINVTPDRGYCFSVRGVAREYGHATGARFTDPGLSAPAGSGPVPAAGSRPGFAVELADDAPIHGVAGADRFVARIVRGIDPGASSPEWLQRRLRQAGMRPISLAVDATNYVMLDLGQPTHAYDLGTLHEPIVVRRAAPGEVLVTLDDAERRLDPEDLLITDSPDGPGSRVIGIAGVMGGASTEVTAATTDVLIEAAHFDPVTIARSARRHKLPSEASRRFERGVDPALQAVAAQRVIDLLVAYGGGSEDIDAVTDLDATSTPRSIPLRVDAASARVGVDYGADEVTASLRDLGAVVAEGASGELEVTPPTWRPDLVHPVDLIEEIVRLRGYDQVPSVVPRGTAGAGLSRTQRLRRSAERTLAESGLVQVLSSPFVPTGVHDALGEPDDDPRRRAERLANPLADDTPELRTTVLASLLPIAARNLGRGAESAALFEVGLVTHARPGGPSPLPAGGVYPGDEVVASILKAVPTQPRHVAGVLTRAEDGAERAIGLAVRLAASLGVPATLEAAAHAPFHPGRCAALVSPTGEGFGHAGELAPAVCAALGLPARAVGFELDLDALVAAVPAQPQQVGKLSAFPVAKEDIALVVDESVPAAAVREAVLRGAGDLVESVELFDVYRGDQLDDGTKSLAFALRLRAHDRTLTAAETAAVRERAVAEVAERLGGRLRA